MGPSIFPPSALTAVLSGIGYSKAYPYLSSHASTSTMVAVVVPQASLCSEVIESSQEVMKNPIKNINKFFEKYNFIILICKK
jgi:hypothetical protein